MGLRLSVGLLEDYKNKHKMIMLIGALSSGCVSLFRIIFNNGIGFLIENLFQDLPGQWASSSGVCFRNDFISYDLWKYCKSFFNAICLFVFSSDLFNCIKYFFYIL